MSEIGRRAAEWTTAGVAYQSGKFMVVSGCCGPLKWGAPLEHAAIARRRADESSGSGEGLGHGAGSGSGPKLLQTLAAKCRSGVGMAGNRVTQERTIEMATFEVPIVWWQVNRAETLAALLRVARRQRCYAS